MFFVLNISLILIFNAAQSRSRRRKRYKKQFNKTPIGLNVNYSIYINAGVQWWLDRVQSLPIRTAEQETTTFY